MNLFNNDPKLAEKRFYKQFWDFADEKRQTDETYVNQEAEMWKEDIQKKAQQAILKHQDQEAVDLQMKEYYESLN